MKLADGKTFRYPGEHVDVAWHGRLCIHIGECGRAKGELFVGGRKPWCQPDLSSDDEVHEVMLRCPTGALTADFKDGSHVEVPNPVNTINVAYNGPLFVRGDLSIADAPANAPGLKLRAALCRCGKSANKPYCDNSHETEGFQDYGAVGETGDAEAASGGELNIRPVKDGPVLIDGNVTITNGSGRESWRGSKVALCRCGASNNKPFCDGAHKKSGFSSD